MIKNYLYKNPLSKEILKFPTKTDRSCLISNVRLEYVGEEGEEQKEQDQIAEQKKSGTKKNAKN